MENTIAKPEISLDSDTLNKALRRGRSLRARCIRESLSRPFLRLYRWVRSAVAVRREAGNMA